MVILVSAHPDSVPGRHVLAFCLEAVTVFKLERVFFYAEGVLHAHKRFPPDDEVNGSIHWQQVHDSGVDLAVCVGAALRRGLVDAEQSAVLQQPGSTLCSGFRLAGLAELAESYYQAKRRVHFGSV